MVDTPSMDRAVVANAEWARRHAPPEPGAGPSLAVLTCMDARIDVYAALGLATGQAHVIRNAGGAATEDAIRSLVLSQRLFGTGEIAVIHHSDCGMLTFRDDELRDEIERETGLRPPFAFEAFTDLDGDVRQTVARLRATPFLPRTDAIRGFVLDVGTGRLREVDLGG